MKIFFDPARKYSQNSLLSLLFISLFFLGQHVHSADPFRMIINSYAIIEYATIVSSLPNGSSDAGTMTVNEDSDCNSCLVQLSYSKETVLHTPLGSYQGLSKLKNWLDYPMDIKYHKESKYISEIEILSSL